VDPHRARLYRVAFAFAAAWNVAFGLFAGLAPQAFFTLLRLEPPRYPAIWQCLGMVVGLYGVGYAYAARRLDRAPPFIAIGLAGKLLGPIGLVLTIRSGEWPLRTITLCFLNDLVWWTPFALFLLEGTRLRERLRDAAPWTCAALNAAAAAGMLLAIRPGTEIVTDPAARAAYIATHPVVWRCAWALWLCAATSLLGFYAWWGARLPPAATRWATAGFAVAAAGLLLDFTAESLFIGWLPERLEPTARAAGLLSGLGANGLYTIGGMLLTARAGAPLLGWKRVWAWAIWCFGLGLSAATLAGNVPGIVAASAGLMTLFVPFAAWLGCAAR
jgi:hypothetical protein